MKIEIVNFEIIEKAELEVEGVTLLLGPSNQGKSSIMRAIKSALYGRQGDDYIRHGAPASTVSLGFDQHYIVRSKAKSALVYYIDGQKYEKVGRTKPAEIEAMFKYKEVAIGSQTFHPNFYNPDEPLFLVRYTPSERFAYLALVIEESKFGDIVRSIVDTNKKAGKEAAALETQIALLDDEVRQRSEELQLYAEIAPFFPKISEYEAKEEQLGELTDWKAALDHTGVQAVQVSDEIGALTRKSEGFADCASRIQALKKLAIYQDTLEATAFASVLQERCTALGNCGSAYKDQQIFLNNAMGRLSALAAKEKEVTGLRDAYISLDKACEFLRGEVAKLATQEKEIKENLTECPLCGSTLDEGKKARILGGA